MTQRTFGNLAAISFATLAIVGTLLEALLYLNSDASLNVGLAIPPLVFTSVGALIVAKRPFFSVGWFLVGAGICLMLSHISYEGSLYLVDNGYRDGIPWIALLSELTFELTYGLFVPLLLIVFPVGQPLSQGWRRLITIIVVGNAINIVLRSIHPGTVRGYEDISWVSSPLGISALNEMSQALLQVMSVTQSFWSLLGVLAVGIRLRNAKSAERQQLKWLAWSSLVFAGALGLITGIGLLVEDTNYAVVNYGLPLIAILGSAAMPISIGIAILRHNLYDIDLIINKTLVYSLLTGSLALVYLGGVLLLQLLLQPLAPDSDLAIAASTLAVAALFQPLRRRIQDAVDRRFYRRKYDAAQTLEQFAGQLREQVDLLTLRTELESIVQETMQPASVSLWLRAGEQPRRRPAS